LSENRRNSAEGAPRTLRGFFHDTIVFPLLLLCVYSVLLFCFLPKGINHSFLGNLLVFLCASVVAVAGLWFFAPGVEARAIPGRRQGEDRLRKSDLVLVLFPLAPVVKYLVINQATLLWTDIGIVLLICLGACTLVAWLIPFFLRRLISPSQTLIPALVLSHVLLNMAALSLALNWQESGRFEVQFFILALSFLICYVTYINQRGALYLLVSVYFSVSVGGEYLTFLSLGSEYGEYSSNSNGSGEAQLSRIRGVVGDRPVNYTPDILLMTYDSYVGSGQFKKYGIDNREQEEFLESLGFTLYPGIYTLAGASKDSMGGVLGGVDTSKAAAGFSPYLELLKNEGYETAGIFSNGYFFRGVGSGYGTTFPDPTPAFLVFLKAVLEGEFRHDVEFKPIPEETFLRAKREVIREATDRPLFLYTHTGPGHSQNSGRCMDDEVSQFKGRLARANLEMREDIEMILRERPGAIVIVNGDHGPYLTQNCTMMRPEDYEQSAVTRLDIQDRFGAFLAIRWPKNQPGPAVAIEILQDIFPAVMADLYGAPQFDELRVRQVLTPVQRMRIAGLDIQEGKIVGGAHHGQALFEDEPQN
jgi:hypothetical protein